MRMAEATDFPGFDGVLKPPTQRAAAPEALKTKNARQAGPPPATPARRP